MRKLDTESGIELYEGEAIVFKEGKWAVLSYQDGSGKFWGLSTLHLPCNMTGPCCVRCGAKSPENMIALVKLVNMDSSDA